MKILFNTRLFALLCLILVGVISSCKKDTDISSSTKVELLSFGPAGVKHGEEISFIGHNLDKVTEIDLVGASIPSSSFLTQTRELITLIVPKDAEKGLVTLKTTDGEDIISKTVIDFEVPVVITSFTSKVKPGNNITIKGEFLNWITGVQFEKDTVVTEFVSQSLTELVVNVPLTAQTGYLTFYGGGTEPLTIESEDELQVILPSITDLSPNPLERGENLTIIGTDLDLTKEVVFKGSALVTEFVSKSPTKLVVKVPEGANKGKVSLVAYSDVIIESEKSLLFVGDLPDLDPLGFAFYIDNLENGAQDWGWSTNTDFSNAENVRDGELAMKVVYDGSWGGVKLANFDVSTTPYSELTFSIFGTPGTEGKVINLSANDGLAYPITVEEGKWVEYSLDLSDIGSPGSISSIMFQETGWAGTIYMDHIGLR